MKRHVLKFYPNRAIVVVAFVIFGAHSFGVRGGIGGYVTATAMYWED